MLTFIAVGLAIYVFISNQALSRRLEQLELDFGRLRNKTKDGDEQKNPASKAPPKDSPQPEYAPHRNAEQTYPDDSDMEPGADNLPEEPALPQTIDILTVIERPEIQPAERKTPSKRVDWEHFSGETLAAWIGGFALFLGAAFFVKYSFENGLITPFMRILIGFLTATALLVTSGLSIKNPKYNVMRQTLAASAIAIYYAVIFAARTYYGFIGTPAAFIMMSLTTATGCVASARLNSQYIAILAMLGGFMTPPLLSTGVDKPVALFSYIALLDIGLLALSRVMGWGFLTALSAAGTFGVLCGWHAKFFSASKVLISAWTVSLFALLFSWMLWLAEKAGKSGATMRHATGMFLLILTFFPAILANSPVVQNNWMQLAAMFLLNALLSLFLIKMSFAGVWHALCGIITFLSLLAWTSGRLTPELLPWALGYFTLFAGMHALVPIVLSKVKPNEPPAVLSALFPVFFLLLPAIHMAGQQTASLLVWPAILLINIFALLAAIALGMLWIGLLAVIMTCAVFFTWLERLSAPAELGGFIVLTLLFAAAFFALGAYLMRKNIFKPKPAQPKAKTQDKEASSLNDPVLFSAVAASLPFMLLAFAAIHLKPEDPSLIFGATLALSGMLWLLVKLYGAGQAAAAAMAFSFLPLVCWHNAAFNPQAPATPFVWYGIFLIALSLPPFLFPKQLLGQKTPWAASALIAPMIFALVYNGMKQCSLNYAAGAVTALFALFEIALLIKVHGYAPLAEPAQKTRLALYGSMALLFISLIFPIQLDKEWITLGWALEGTALLWLYGRVSHEGLKRWALLLLSVAFLRLACNPAVLAYHPRQAVPIANWFLYTYGVACAALYCGAALWRPKEERMSGIPARGLLQMMATVLLFLLVNIEIADYFSTGRTLTFQFSGNFARDMSYTLAWGLFALATLLSGIKTGSKTARTASLLLLAATVLKLFFHDLWQLGLLYRAGAFVGIAGFLIAVSYFYQRYLGPANKEAE